MDHGITCTTCGATGAAVTVTGTTAACTACGATWAVNEAQVAAYRHAAAHERGYAGYRMAYEALRPRGAAPATPVDVDDGK